MTELGQRARLQAAYAATTYRVLAPAGPIDIRLGQPALIDAPWAIITACNRGSRRATRAANEAATFALLADLQLCDLIRWPELAIPDDPAWPAEPGVCVLDIAPGEALDSARRYGQLAIITGALGGPARCCWT